MQIAIAATRAAAMLLAQARPGVTVIQRGEEAAALTPLPLGVLEKVCDVGTQLSQSSQRNLRGLCVLSGERFIEPATPRAATAESAR